MSGLTVALITEEDDMDLLTTFPVEPLESIHPGVSSLLKKAGLDGAEKMATCSVYSGIYSSGYYSPLGEDSTGIWEGMHLHRKTFNAQLLKQIKDAGIAIRFNEKVGHFIKDNDIVIGVQSGSEELYASYTIDATGKQSIAGRLLHFKRQFFSPPLVCWTGVSENFRIFPFDKDAAHFKPGIEGWTWLAPYPSDYCSWTRLRAKGEKLFEPPDECRDYDTIGKIKVTNMRWRMFRPVCKEGILLCGDAAGILDPAAGQGILNALWSGIIAANTTIACLKEPDLAGFHLAAYDGWFVQQFEMKVTQLREYYNNHGIQLLK